MEFYKVGGCVRDFLMNDESKDIDWVVVGATEQDMLDRGFTKVGADFPVFLHPDNGQEYALARTERKTGKGYNGFTVDIENVTLKDDLKRRDLTINAMALDPHKNVIDYFNGMEDIKNSILRHVDAEAFKEDPVRVLRIGRFLARWPEFAVAKETMTLCREMVLAGELEHLTPERVWKETEKALCEIIPSRYFVFLRMVGALEIVFPEIYALIGQTQPYEHHPEGDAFVHTMQVLDNCAEEWYDEPLGPFCALTHDLGKGTTHKDKLPHHSGHEQRGVEIIKTMCERLRIPNAFRDHAMLVSAYHTHIHNFHILKATTIVKMFDDLNFRKNKNIINILPLIAFADATGRTLFHKFRPYPNRDRAITTFYQLSNVKISNYFSKEEIQDMSIDNIKNYLYKEKVKIVKQIRKGENSDVPEDDELD